MIVKHQFFNFPSKGPYPRILDITDDIKIFVESSGIKTGIVNIQYKHTTGAILIQENEPMLLEDLLNTLNRLVPPESEDVKYKHNDVGGARTKNICEIGLECANADAHIKAALLGGPVRTLNIAERKLVLGEWQRILLFDGDRDYGVDVVVLGEG